MGLQRYIKAMGGGGVQLYIFTFMHLADAFIQSDLQCYTFVMSVHIYIYIYIISQIPFNLFLNSFLSVSIFLDSVFFRFHFMDSF